jgi:uncharacterized OsmC-like protein
MKIAARVSIPLQVTTSKSKPKVADNAPESTGGELLFAALATRVCNDLYREAAKRDIAVQNVKVKVTGTSLPRPSPCRRDRSYD